MGKVDVVLGLQWGDEGKGKIVDVLAPGYNIIARFQGGPNAGHTLEFDGIKHVLHLIPSGIFYSHVVNVIGNGVVMDPVLFAQEDSELMKKFGIRAKENLIISDKANLILPTHRLLDNVNELAKGNAKIGSTGKGIGPTYQDAVARIGMKMGDILKYDFETFRKKYYILKERHLEMIPENSLKFKRNIDGISLDEYEQKWFKAIKRLKSFSIQATEYYLNKALDAGKNVLAEGAQGTLLDIYFGTYPFVTSSNVTTSGVCAGLGVAPSRIGEVFGVFKAYITRVGNGPFPTELYHKGNPYFQMIDGKNMAEFGHEVGATTGRPRRCGWLDLPALKYACMINGVTQLIMTKADVLCRENKFTNIDVATSYNVMDRSGFVDVETRFYPDQLDAVKSCIYVSFAAWSNLSGLKVIEDIIDSDNMSFDKFVSFIERDTNIPITMISIGPDRKEILSLTE